MRFSSALRSIIIAVLAPAYLSASGEPLGAVSLATDLTKQRWRNMHRVNQTWPADQAAKLTMLAPTDMPTAKPMLTPMLRLLDGCGWSAGALVAFGVTVAPAAGHFLSLGRDVVSDQPCWLHAVPLQPPLSPTALFELEAAPEGLSGAPGDVLLRSLSSGRLLRAMAPGDAGSAWVVQAAGEAARADDLGVRWRLDTAPAPASMLSAAVAAVQRAWTGAAASCTVHLLARGTGGYVNLPAAAATDVRTHQPGGIAACVETPAAQRRLPIALQHAPPGPDRAQGGL